MPKTLRLGLVAACVLAVSASTSAQDASTTTYGPWTSAGIRPTPPPRAFEVPDDENLEFIVKDGFGGWGYADCKSEAPGTPAISNEQGLPVGNGRSLVCKTIASPLVLEREVMAEDGARYCWKGTLARYRTASDPRLKLSVAQTPQSGPWTLRATSETAWTVKRISFSFGTVWPLWLELQYKTIGLAPARNNSCDGVFRR